MRGPFCFAYRLVRSRVRVELAVDGCERGQIVYVSDQFLRAPLAPATARRISAVYDEVKIARPTGPNVSPTGKYLPERATMASTSRARFVLRIWLNLSAWQPCWLPAV